MKKIGIISAGVLPLPAIKGGAVESLIDEYVSHNIKEKRFHLTVFSIYDKNLNNVKSEFVDYIYIKNNKFFSFLDKIISLFQKTFFKNKNATTFKNLLNRFHFFLKIRKYLKRIDFDLLVLENHPAEYICLKTKYLQNKYHNKVIFHSHNIPAHYKRLTKWISCTKAFYSVSSSLSSLWENALIRYCPQLKFEVLKNGVDLNVFKPLEDCEFLANKKKEYHIPIDKKIVLYTGRMVKSKGVLEVINSMMALDDSYHLLLVGDYYYGVNAKNKDFDEIKKALFKIDGRYSFTGFVDRKTMPLIYNLADVVVLPSIEYDAAPLTLIESICCCKPVVATNIGGIPEYSKDAGVVLVQIDENLSKNIAINIKNIATDSNYRNNLISKSFSDRRNKSSSMYTFNYEKMILQSME